MDDMEPDWSDLDEDMASRPLTGHGLSTPLRSDESVSLHPDSYPGIEALEPSPKKLRKEATMGSTSWVERIMEVASDHVKLARERQWIVETACSGMASPMQCLKVRCSLASDLCRVCAGQRGACR